MITPYKSKVGQKSLHFGLSEGKALLGFSSSSSVLENKYRDKKKK
jgi:hypothetical protein